MARNKRSLANRRPFVPSIVKQICESWPLAERLAFHQTMTRRWSFDEDVNAYKRRGVRAFGAWRFKVDDVGEHKALDLIKEHDLTVSSLSWAGGFVYCNGEANESAIADALEAVEMARTIDSPNLIVLPGSRGAYTMNHGRRMVIDALRQVADVAALANVQLAIQPVDPEFAGEGCFLESLDKLIAFLGDCGHSHIGLNLDLFHLRKTPGLRERLPDLLPWIRIVQLSDSQNPATDLDRCLLGDGDLPLLEIIEDLEVLGYRGFYEAVLMSKSAWNSPYEKILERTSATFNAWSQR